MISDYGIMIWLVRSLTVAVNIDKIATNVIEADAFKSKNIIIWQV